MSIRKSILALRRKKGILFVSTFLITVYMVIHMKLFGSDHYIPLQVLPNAESEARRLLRLFNIKNYECNNSVVVGNRSMAFPICVGNDTGFNIDKEAAHGVVYSIGLSVEDDFVLEHTLANSSFPVFIITHNKLPSYLFDLNNTFYLPTRIVANDFADFSRNSYSQHTINDIMNMLKHTELDIIKIWSVPPGVQMWELIYYMIRDRLLFNVKQFHFHIQINTVEEDLLYNWYRTLYNLFYEAKFSLYHVSANSPLCLQVTMMESCSYYLSWIQDPGPRTFVMHPPADFGSEQLERDRLLDFINNKRVTCHKLYEVEQSVNKELIVTPPPSWMMCIDRFFNHKCRLYSFSSDGHVRTLEKAIKNDLQEVKTCEVHHLIPKTTMVMVDSETYSEVIECLITEEREEVNIQQSLYEMSLNDHVSVVEINLSGHIEWSLLREMLHSGALANTSQVLLKISLASPVFGTHPKVLRYEFSQLKQLEKQGFHLFYSSPCTDSIHKQKQNKDRPNCYQLGFSRTESIFNHPRPKRKGRLYV